MARSSNGNSGGAAIAAVAALPAATVIHGMLRVDCKSRSEDATMSDVIELTRDGDLAFVALNRPDKLNALDKAMWQRLTAVMERGRRRRRCALRDHQRGTGAAFGAGADVAEFASERDTPAAAEAYAGDHGRRAGRVARLARCRRWRRSTAPAPAPGWRSRSIAIIRLAAAGSRFGIPIQRLGIGLPYPEIGGAGGTGGRGDGAGDPAGGPPVRRARRRGRRAW